VQCMFPLFLETAKPGYPRLGADRVCAEAHAGAIVDQGEETAKRGGAGPQRWSEVECGPGSIFF
jgi:hypothetical protein